MLDQVHSLIRYRYNRPHYHHHYSKYRKGHRLHFRRNDHHYHHHHHSPPCKHRNNNRISIIKVPYPVIHRVPVLKQISLPLKVPIKVPLKVNLNIKSSNNKDQSVRSLKFFKTFDPDSMVTNNGNDDVNYDQHKIPEHEMNENIQIDEGDNQQEGPDTPQPEFNKDIPPEENTKTENENSDESNDSEVPDSFTIGQFYRQLAMNHYPRNNGYHDEQEFTHSETQVDQNGRFRINQTNFEMN